jgi:hypothetical protein
MGLSWQQGSLARNPNGRFLTASPMPERLLFAEPLRRRMSGELDKGVGSSQLAHCLCDPGTTAAYHTSGHFPDGTVLIREVCETATAPMTTGTISHAQTLKGWFVMVKESRNSHPGNLLWGDGWAWSFDGGNPRKTPSTSYKKDCLACHVPAKATDWVYTSGCPAPK